MKQISLTEAASLRVIHASSWTVPQVQSSFQWSRGGGRWHLFLFCHPHWRSFFQLHPVWGRLAAPTKDVRTSVCSSTCIYHLICLSQSWRGCWSSVTTTNFPVSRVFFAVVAALIWIVSLSRLSSLQTSYSTEVRFGCGAAGEGQSSLLAAGWQDFS